MKVAVWDTYVKKENGNVIHFDIIAPESITEEETIFRYGESFLSHAGIRHDGIDAARCQYCHTETPTDEMIASITEQGYYILVMDEIPAVLPPNPTKRQLVFHLKAHYPQHRYANFIGKPMEEIQQLLP